MRRAALVLILTLNTAIGAAHASNDVMRFPSGISGLALAMRHTPPATSVHDPRPVLILHGATFPSENAADWKMDGWSWMDDLSAKGYDVYALDFLGYGASDRYPEMSSNESAGSPLGDIEAMTDQVNRAVHAICEGRTDTKVSIVAHSAGTLVAGRFAAEHGDRVAKLVLFGAPTPPARTRNVAPAPPLRYFQMGAKDQLEAFEPRVRENGNLDAKMFEGWVKTYLSTDPLSVGRTPASVRVPSGMQAALTNLDATGRLPYRPAVITVPTLVIQGEWDFVTSPEQGLWLFNQLGSPLKRFVLLSRAGHRAHLERGRRELFEEIESFLR